MFAQNTNPAEKVAAQFKPVTSPPVVATLRWTYDAKRGDFFVVLQPVRCWKTGRIRVLLYNVDDGQHTLLATATITRRESLNTSADGIAFAALRKVMHLEMPAMKKREREKHTHRLVLELNTDVKAALLEGGHTYDEIAQATGKSRNTVKKVKKALEALTEWRHVQVTGNPSKSPAQYLEEYWHVARALVDDIEPHDITRLYNHSIITVEKIRDCLELYAAVQVVRAQAAVRWGRLR